MKAKESRRKAKGQMNLLSITLTFPISSFAVSEEHA
jgi:hypothetical protein